MLRSEMDLPSLLTLYARVQQGKRVADDETNPLVGVLRLSGIVRGETGRLHVRNRIYARAFDKRWVAASMPDAELQRQRAAYRRGLLRATVIAAVVMPCRYDSGLGLSAWSAQQHQKQHRRVPPDNCRAPEDKRPPILDHSN